MFLKDLSMLFSLSAVDIAFKDNVLYVKKNNYPIRVSEKVNLTNMEIITLPIPEQITLVN